MFKLISDRLWDTIFFIILLVQFCVLPYIWGGDDDPDPGNESEDGCDNMLQPSFFI